MCGIDRQMDIHTNGYTVKVSLAEFSVFWQTAAFFQWVRIGVWRGGRVYIPCAMMPTTLHRGSQVSVSRTPLVMSRRAAHFWAVYVGWLEAKCVDSEVLTVELGWIKIGILEPTSKQKTTRTELAEEQNVFKRLFYTICILCLLPMRYLSSSYQ